MPTRPWPSLYAEPSGQRLAGGSRRHRRAEGEQPAEEFDEECEDFRVALGWASAKEASAT